MSSSTSRSGYRYACVCAANFNRSMEAHRVLLENGFDVKSYGAASRVKLPGASRDDPNVYDFDGTSYEEILRDLRSQSEDLVKNYEERGMFDMLVRNAKIKRCPERWKTHRERGETFDVIVCFEERVFDLVVMDLKAAGGARDAALVVNLDVRDSYEGSAEAAPRALRLCERLERCEEGWEGEIDSIVDEFEREEGLRALYCVCFY
ncbi:RNA polymerase II subunit A [Ostreococcus tauri]|uniref:RNA polymerase II subunit A C-terminal domain phosphatase SSU72 n=1 Tax=Ostreococcus tauri TaxID=70448 RepID=A0A1Y5I7Y7_OSTTA|nr:RNA polymerase II subunit A [Ostreococcus tauri]